MRKITQFLDIFINRHNHSTWSFDYFLNKIIKPVVVILVTFLAAPQPTIADPSFLIGGFRSATGMDGGLHTNSPTRQKIDLAGTWQVSVNGGEPVPVEVPSAYDGVGELVYERSFDISPELLDEVSFQFIAYGINYNAEVIINGTVIGNHSGGYTSFSLPVIRDILHPGENTIRIHVNNFLKTRSTLPVKAQIGTPKNYGGIYRDIYLLVMPETAILNNRIRTNFLDGYSVAEMNIDVTIGKQEVTVDELRAEQEDVSPSVYHVMVEVIDRIRGTVLVQSQRQQFSFDNVRTVNESVQVIARNPRLWSPDQPDLYTVSIVVFKDGDEIDRENIIYGFRDLTIRDGAIYLNGESFRGRGIMYHEYHPRRGSAVSYEDLERDVALMKIANINFVRVAFHPPHPYLLNLFDRYGMVCMIEIPAVNIPGTILGDNIFRSTARTYLEEMIERDRHHPSVLGWGIGDNLETPHHGAVEYVLEMREHARSLDDRPVYAGSQFAANDIATEHLDLAVLNIPPRLTEGVSQSVGHWNERYPEKPLIIGKLGYYIEPGNTAGYSDPGSYEAQARYLLQMMQMLRGQNVDAIVVNSFTDWRAERPMLIGHNEHYTLHTTGVVDADRRSRRGFEVIRALYRGEKIPPLTAGDAPGITPVEYIVGGFLVLLGFAYMLNSNRRFRDNVNRSLLRPYNFYSDVRDQRILSGFHTFYLGLLISLTMAMIFASFLQHYSQNQIIDYAFTHFLIVDSAKLMLAGTVHTTWQLIVILAGLYFIMLVFVGIAVQIGSLFVRTKVSPSHSFVVTFWSALPLVAFIPLSMILYNVLQTEFYVVPILSLIGILLLWVFLRLLKGIAIIYDVSAFRIYIIGIGILLGVNAVMLLVSEYMQSTFSYISFFIHMSEGFRF